MEAVIIVFFVFAFGIVVYHFITYSEKPEDTPEGRWGKKIGKVYRGDFGGKEWGQKTKKDDKKE